MERKIIYFMIDDIIFETEKPEITLDEIRTGHLQIEGENITMNNGLEKAVFIKKAKMDKKPR